MDNDIRHIIQKYIQIRCKRLIGGEMGVVNPKVIEHNVTSIVIEYKYKKKDYNDETFTDNVRGNSINRIYYAIEKLINSRCTRIALSDIGDLDGFKSKKHKIIEELHSDKYGLVQGRVECFGFKYTLNHNKTTIYLRLNLSIVGDIGNEVKQAYVSMNIFNRYYAKVIGYVNDWMRKNNANEIIELRGCLKDLGEIADLGVDFWYKSVGRVDRNIKIQRYIYELYRMGIDPFGAFRSLMSKYKIDIPIEKIVNRNIVEYSQPEPKTTRSTRSISRVDLDYDDNKKKKKKAGYRENVKRAYIKAYPKLGEQKFIVEDTEVRIYNLFKGKLTREIAEASQLIVARPDVKFRKEVGNKSKYFDFIDIDLSIRLSIGDYQARKNACIKNMKALDEIVKRMIESNRTFKANGVALSYFKVEKILTRDSILAYRFSLKQ